MLRLTISNHTQSKFAHFQVNAANRIQTSLSQGRQMNCNSIHWLTTTLISQSLGICHQGRRYVLSSGGMISNEALARKPKIKGPRWGPGAKPLVGVQGAKPSEAPGVYRIFNAKYCLNLYCISTHSSYKCSPI